MEKIQKIEIHNTSTDELKKSIIKDLSLEFKKIIESLELKKEEEYLTRKELADIFKVSLPTISDWSKKGILKPYRLGKLIRFKKSDLENTLVQINSLDK